MAFYFWGLLALGLAGALVFSSQLEFLVPAVAAGLVLAVAFIPGLGENYVAQAILWVLLTGAGLLLFRNKLRRWKSVSKKSAEDSVAGKTAVVTEEIGEGTPGRIRFGGTTWIAVSAEPVATGTEVLILGQEGLVFQVEQTSRDKLAEELRELELKSKSEEL